MENQRIIALVGDSLFMDTVEASLKSQQGMNVIRIQGYVGDVKACVESVHPDLVIFDWDTYYSRFVMLMLKDQPGIPFIGLDVSSRQVIVMSSQQYTPLTVNDLAQVIQLYTPLPQVRGREIQQHNLVLNRRGSGLIQWQVVRRFAEPPAQQA